MRELTAGRPSCPEGNTPMKMTADTFHEAVRHEAMRIAGEICVYTNDSVTLEELK